MVAMVVVVGPRKKVSQIFQVLIDFPIDWTLALPGRSIGWLVGDGFWFIWSVENVVVWSAFLKFFSGESWELF